MIMSYLPINRPDSHYITFTAASTITTLTQLGIVSGMPPL